MALVQNLHKGYLTRMSSSAVRLSEGQFEFSGGVDSSRVPLVASDQVPNGLRQDQLAWLTNGTVRGGGITPRFGFKYLTKMPVTALFQGGFMYDPGNAFPYLMLQVAGRTYQVRVDTDNSIHDVTAAAANSATITQSFFCQGESFMAIQDGTAEPLIWDGTVLRRVSAMGGTAPFMPTGQCMDYSNGRWWVATGRFYTAGDIVGGPSGTAPRRFTDAILHWTENAFLAGGGAFSVPTSAGNIRALAHTANLDTALGQSPMYVFTRKTIYQVTVPASRSTWNAYDPLTTTKDVPLVTVAQRNFGCVAERSIVPINGDLYFQIPGGFVQSLMISTRFFGQPGNTPISNNENRAIQFNDRALLPFASGIELNNRVLQTVLPVTTPVGVAFQGLMPLDFDIISTLEKKLPPAWEGIQLGLDILQVWSGDFGGRTRAFAAVHSRIDDSIEIWELTSDERTDTNATTADNRVTTVIEFPARSMGDLFRLKELDCFELWVDKLYGKVEFTVEWRPDQHPCWQFWATWIECAARNSCEDVDAIFPCPYPAQTYREQYRIPMVLQKPPRRSCENTNGRPFDLGYSFQIRLTIKGWCRVRGAVLHCLPRDTPPFQGIRCIG